MDDTSAVLQPFSVNYTLLHVDIPAVTIILGQLRVTVKGPDDQSRFGTHGHIEWSAAYEMPLPTAKHLLWQIGKVIEDYERQYGPIPVVSRAEPPHDSVVPIRRVMVVPGEPAPRSDQPLDRPEPPSPAA